ncbi:MAG TPA: GNAT family N-acetyltransferase [Candidatus Kapabacteria bacterium]
MITLEDISIRTELQPGDIGHITSRHGVLYAQEYGWGIGFESYVAAGLHEFYRDFNSNKDRIWIAELEGKIIGSILVKSRGESAQLRYFYIEPEYRGIRLGKKLWSSAMDFISSCGYISAYLWTAGELHVAAKLYTSTGFRLTEEKESTSFGARAVEQRYDWDRID